MLKILVVATLYTALSITANPAFAEPLGGVAALREETMRKLNFHDAPRAVSEQRFTDFEETEYALSDFEGQLLILNFWATWCAPCRKEMPAFDALAAQFSEAPFAIVPVATGRNPRPAIEKFFEAAEISNLPIRLDKTGSMARDMGVFGLPATIIISPEGQEIARMTGDADWHSASAQKIISALLEFYESGDASDATDH